MSIESMNPAAMNPAAMGGSPTTTGVDTQSSTAVIANEEQKQAVSVENQQQVPSAEELEKAVERLNEMMKDGQRSLSFSVDQDLEEVVVTVTDVQTDKVIRQIPNEESLQFAKNLEGVLGVIFNEEA